MSRFISRFIPIDDELIHDHPERIPTDGSALLVPFHLALVHHRPAAGSAEVERREPPVAGRPGERSDGHPDK